MLLLTQIRLERNATSTVMSHRCVKKLQVMVLPATDFHSRFASVYWVLQQGKRLFLGAPVTYYTGTICDRTDAQPLQLASRRLAALTERKLCCVAQSSSHIQKVDCCVYCLQGLPCLRQFSQLFSFFHSELIHGCSDVCALILQLQVRCGCRYD